jgi:5-methyltetrahydropteroyltriglutamate--homocysteine methyltransferase
MATFASVSHPRRRTGTVASPRVPPTDEIAALLRCAAESVPRDWQWVNPDRGLKRRSYDDVGVRARAPCGCCAVRAEVG